MTAEYDAFVIYYLHLNLILYAYDMTLFKLFVLYNKYPKLEYLPARD